MRLHRSIAYALLSLLLVLSQQMGISHGMSHWADAAPAARSALQDAGQDGRHAAKSLAVDQSCAQCLAFAQIGTILAAPLYAVPSLHSSAPTRIAALTPPTCLRTVCVFQPRAPPAPV
ncbi:hypothetical protein [Janthinobacterium sp.]|uniref:hypothetical protein n=1 Tax=Janthinobacterium sp. TaxID=1871054 RepID=UPI00293D58AD|nr:hypothetical protein [Janthinobacterium sp.]